MRFEVEDRGRGIEAAERERLFEPFTQMRRAPPDRDRGSGLGLAICRHLAERIRELTDWRLPIVAVTAHLARQELNRRDTIDAFILKPFDPDELERTLARLTDQRARVPFLDRSVLCGHLEHLGTERTARILAAFERVCASTLAELDVRAPADVTILTAASHRLRGSANSLGLRNLARQAAKLEVTAVRVTGAELEGLVEDLRMSAARSRRVLVSAWRALVSEVRVDAPVSGPGPVPRTDSQRRAG